jgi:lipoate-protein ligase A
MPLTTDNGPRTSLPCRLFIDPPAEGAWNMAVDEALLDQAADEGLASLRFYRWREPTLSLGYFQRYDERALHAPSRDAAVVRRLSGGGALIHDRELTYSLCLPASHPLARETVKLYESAHEALIDTLGERGIAASLHGRAAMAPAEQPDEPFLCFARRTSADVVLAETSTSASAPIKIVGSAQRRRRGAVLQHGAVLLETSPSAPELPGLDRAGAARLAADELIAPWSARLAARLNLRLVPTDFEMTSAFQTCKKHYAKHVSAAWLARR